MLPSVARKATERESKRTRQRTQLTEKVENEIDFVSIVHYNGL